VADLHERVKTAVKGAMKQKATIRLATLRLINAAIKDKQIASRIDGQEQPLSEADILAILGKMVKQRLESARAYEEAGRLDLSERERAEIVIVEEFLPKQLTDEEVEVAIATAIADTGAVSIRDMGRVMGILKGAYIGQIDFGRVGPMIKQRLCAPAE
jgi:uncharacterized protein YqeY